MESISTGALLEPVSSDQPCGPDLEYSGVMELERLAQGKPERQSGNVLLPAEEPDWGAVARTALGLAGQTKDLRVLVKLTQALLRTEGFSGLANGLALIRATAEQYWECLHPPVDPDDGDPTARLNTLLGLCDPDLVTRPLRDTPLVQVQGLGRFSLRDIAIASGSLPAPADREPPTLALIDAAFAQVDIDPLQGVSESIAGAIADLRGTEAFVTEQVGAAAAIAFEPLEAVLLEAAKTVRDRLARRGATTDAAPNDAAPRGDDSGPGQSRTLVGDVASREDVARVLDRVCEYYRRHEPSSPVPLLLERAKRLATMDFMSIVQDLAPSGVPEVEAIRGPVPEQ